MFLILLKYLGIKQQAVVNISEHEMSVTDINSGKKEMRSRISKHPRSIVGDFYEVEKELRALIKSVFPKLWIYSEVIICLQGQDKGGYTTVEKRAVRELAFGAGAHIVYVSELPVSNEQAARVFRGENIEHELSDA